MFLNIDDEKKGKYGFAWNSNSRWTSLSVSVPPSPLSSFLYGVFVLK